MDDADRIESLAAILREYDLDALRVRVGETEIELVRRDPTVAPVYTVAAPGAAPAPAPSGAVSQSAVAPSHAKKVTAPVVGVFYRSSSPDSEPFVHVGDRVEVGQTVCILEAMKLFNEITTDYAGIVTRIIPENGELVSLDEEMFWIE